MHEQSKAAKRRYRDGDFLGRYFVGAGIDVGAGPDTLGRYLAMFPAMRSVRPWDLADGDAQLLASVPDGSYDFLHSSHCLEHMRDPGEALAHWIRVVRPGGHLVITVPDEDMYEQGVFPSRFNSDHKWTFTIHKAEGSSWSRRSVNVIDLLRRHSSSVEIERLCLVREFFDEALEGQDQTQFPNAECAVEFVLRRRVGRSVAGPEPQRAVEVPIERASFELSSRPGPSPSERTSPASNGPSTRPARFDAALGKEAVALYDKGMAEAAERKALEALLAEPADCLALDVLTRCYLAAARYEECARVLERLVGHVPDSHGAWNNLGCCQAEQRDYAKARASFERAVACKPDYLTAYGGLAAMRYALGDVAGAESAYREVLQRDPEDLNARVNLANCLVSLERLDEATREADHAAARLLAPADTAVEVRLPAPQAAPAQPFRGRIENRPIFESPHARLGMGLLSLGRMGDGLDLMERRLGGGFVPGFDARQAQRLWRGEPLRGRTLLLLWEQGYGDVFQGLRHVEWLAEQAAQILLPADHATRELFEQSFRHLAPKVQVIDWRAPLPGFDFHVSLLSLHQRAHASGIRQPEAVDAYLSADAAAVARFRRLRADENALAVGIVFAGKPDLMLDPWRSMPRAAVAHLTAPLPGVRFYSLQVGARANDCFSLAAQGVVDWSALLDTFADTAAAMKALDGVVVVDTSGLHLAGALGVRATLMNRFGSEYRWQSQRNDGVWYRSVRQVRQPAPGDWSSVARDVRSALAAEARAAGLQATVPSPSFTAAEGSDAAALARLGEIEQALAKSELGTARTLIDAHAQAHPHSPKAACHAGVLSLFEGDRAAARRHFDHAITLQPDYAVAYGNRASARDEPDDAGRVEDLTRAVAFNAAFSTGWANLARVEHRRQRGAAALRHARRAVLVDPDNADTRMLLGEIALDAGELHEALAQFERLRERFPEAPESHANLIPVYGLLERRVDVQAALGQALALDPRHEGAFNNGIQYHLRTQQYEPAFQLIDRYAELYPNKANPHVMRGLALQNTKNYAQSDVALRRALEIEPDHVEALFAMGTLLERVDQLEASERVLRRAIERKRDYRSIVNLAVTLNRQQRYAEARALNDEALALAGEKLCREREPRIAAARRSLAVQAFRAEMQTVDFGFGPDWNNALIDLVQGDYRRGFAGYEARLQQQGVSGMPPEEMQRLLWRGEPLEGKRILLLPEQGYGDVIQFLRYVPEIKRRGATVLVGASRPLERLLAATPGVDQVVPLDDGRRPAFDVMCPLMSLAHHLGVERPGDLLPSLPYLRAPQAARAAWAPRLSALSGKKVGLVWAGRKIYPADRLRSIDLAQIRDALAHHDVHWVSLQVGDCAGEAAEWPGLNDWTADIVDFADTAAIVEGLDLVIAVDTAAAHVAGALGKPVWMFNRISTDWRWGADGDDCGWYPSLRLFRQERHLSWAEPLARIDRALGEWLGAARR